MSNVSNPTIAYLRVTVGPQSEYIRYRGLEVANDTLEISSAKKLKIGRNPREVDLQVYEISDNCAISRLHCSIQYDATAGKFMLCDEGSTNGTYIGDTRLEIKKSAPLNEGDLITLGSAKYNGVQFAFTMLEKSQHQALDRIILRPFDDDAGVVDTKATEDKALFDLIGAEAKSAPVIKKEEEKVKVQVSTKIINKYDVFLSYYPGDSDTMKKIRTYLMNKQHLHIWLDDALEHGTRTRMQIVKNVLVNSYSVVALVSNDAKESKAFLKELTSAQSANVLLIPVLIDGGDKTLPVALPGLEFIDLSGDKLESNLPELAEKIQKHIQENKSTES